jgi:hypothetical protein
MGQRQIKLMRKQIRREQQMLANRIIKPKIKFVPTWLWLKMVKFFIRIEK